MVNVSIKLQYAKEIINEAIKAIINKDFSKLLPKVIESLPDLIQVVVGCLNEKTAIEDEPKAESILCTRCHKENKEISDPFIGVFDPDEEEEEEEEEE